MFRSASFGAILVLATHLLIACASESPVVVVAEPFVHEENAEPNNELLVFVGRRISVVGFKPEMEDGRTLMDAAFLAKYEVISLLRGEYSSPTIEFEVYDHYGYPDFADFQTVVLFVSLGEDGTFYHQKYQYIPVYPSANGGWAGCGDPYAREPDVHRRRMKARDIKFSPPLRFDLAGMTSSEIRKRFPRAYFQKLEGYAECRKGNTVEELLRVKFKGVLAARGI